MTRDFIGRQVVTRIGIVDPLPPVRMAVTKQAKRLMVVDVGLTVVVVVGVVDGGGRVVDASDGVTD